MPVSSVWDGEVEGGGKGGDFGADVAAGAVDEDAVLTGGSDLQSRRWKLLATDPLYSI